MRGARKILAAIVSASAVCAASQTPLVFRFTRPLRVQSSGWVKVPLDPATRGHMTPDGCDMRLYAPSGEETAYQFCSLRASQWPLQARATAVTQAPGGWYIAFDLGPDVIMHKAFHFEFANRVVAQGCRLFASGDGVAWRPLAAGDLFRLGENEDLAETVLDYAPSRDRYLRLWWPKEAGFPDVRNAAAEPAAVSAEPPQRLGLQFVLDQKEAETNGYLLTLPGPGVPLRRLDLRWSGPEVAAYRLYVAADGLWNVISEGVIARPKNGPAQISLAVNDAPGGEIKLELSSGTSRPPGLEAVEGEFEPQWLVFAAQQPGDYTIGYGNAGLAPPHYPSAAPPVALESISLAGAGPEKEQPLPEAPAQSAGLGAPIPKQPFQASWPVQAGTAIPGQLVRLEIPGEVYASAQPSLGDLRLACQGRQVPYVLYAPPSPALVVAIHGAAPVSAGSGRSEILVPLPQKNLPLSSLALFTKSAVFKRGVEVFGQRASSRPGIENEGATMVASGDFLCPGEGELPCRLGLCLSEAGGASALRVAFSDTDNPPLPSVDVALWRRRHVLLFFLPEGEVRLLAGSLSLGQPSYDLAALKEQLLNLPAAKVTLGRSPETEGAAESRTAKWMLAAILVMAGLALSALLAKVIRGAQHG